MLEIVLTCFLYYKINLYSWYLSYEQYTVNLETALLCFYCTSLFLSLFLLFSLQGFVLGYTAIFLTFLILFLICKSLSIKASYKWKNVNFFFLPISIISPLNIFFLICAFFYHTCVHFILVFSLYFPLDPSLSSSSSPVWSQE